MKKLLATFLGLGLVLPAVVHASCPSKEELKEKLRDLLQGSWKIEAVKEIEDAELCAVVVKSGIRSVVLYVDEDVRYLFTGNLFDLKTKKNLTAELSKKYSKVSPEVLKKLEKLTDLKFNPGKEKYVYFISDPDCPFCRRLEPILKEWAKKNNVEIRHIFYPLPMHPKAKEKAIDIICSDKGYEYVHKDFEPKNLCEEGKKKIEENIKYLSKIGVTGTPTLIGMNGQVHVGLPRSEEELNKLIK